MISRLFLAIATATVLASGPAAAQQYRDQDEAYKAARSGEIRPLGEIIARVTPKVRGSFVGSDFDAGTRTYRLKYMREGSVVIVDVDASTGRVLGMSGK